MLKSPSILKFIGKWDSVMKLAFIEMVKKMFLVMNYSKTCSLSLRTRYTIKGFLGHSECASGSHHENISQSRECICPALCCLAFLSVTSFSEIMFFR